ncbi:MAG: YigZ family protein [Anaerolineae bacterium]
MSSTPNARSSSNAGYKQIVGAGFKSAPTLFSMPTPDPYPIPAQETQIEHVVVNSRFIATALCVDNVAAVKEALARLRAALPEANHHVYAYRIGFGNSTIEGMSDDGEPTGTAGPPALAVLRGANIGDTLVVIARIFGGTKLGTGGLVRAYSDSARLVLDATPRQLKIARGQIGFEFAYTFYERIKTMVSNHDGVLDDEIFGQDVSLIATLPLAEMDALTAEVTELTAGRAEIIRFDKDNTS